ncbi:MAG: T9SS type A sorting domain-containing protein, partial [Chitinophagaceae bacterium]|nr:T9SS type A sorting domain-containing protein [Chitinophagaceae bacterium]
GTYTLAAGTPIYIGADRSGNNGHYFILRAYNNEQVIIDGSLQTAAFSNLVSIVNAGYIKLQGLTFANLSGITGYGVFMLGKSHHIELQNCTFNNMSWNTDLPEAKYPTGSDYMVPVRIHGDSSTALSNVVINNTTFNTIAPGVGDLVLISGNTSNITQTNSTLVNIYRQQARTEFYVSTTGNDTTGNGSKAKPWRTLSWALNVAGYDYSTVPATLLDSNLTIYLRGGRYYPVSTGYYIGDNRGANGKWTTIKNYGTENVVIDGSQLNTQYAFIFGISGAKYIRIDGLDIENLENDSTLHAGGYKDVRYGIIVTGAAKHIDIINNDIYNMHWSRDTNKIKNPTPTDVLSAISVLGSTNTPITHLNIENNTVHDITPGYAEAIAINGNVDTFSVIGNEVYDIANIGIVAAGNYKWVLTNNPGLLPENNQSRNGLIKDNEVYRCLSPIAISAGIYLDGSKNITVEGNNSYLNGVGISVGNEQDSSTGTGHLVKENTLYHNLGSGIYVGSNNFTSHVTNSVIKWNTIQNNYYIDSALYRRTQGRYGILDPANRWAEIVINRAENITFEENEITSLSNIMSAFVFGQSGLIFRYNEYYTASNDPCNVYFVRDTTNDGVADVFYNTFHMYAKKMNLDRTSTLGGVAYNSSGCGTSSLATPAKDGTIQVSTFPNPASDQLSVRIQQPATGMVQLSLFDLSGRLMLTQSKQVPAGAQLLGWNNLKQYQLLPGVYFLHVRTNGKKEVLKVLVR